MLCMKLWQSTWTGPYPAHLPTFNWAVRLRRRMDGALSWLPRLRLWPNNLINRQGRPKARAWHAFIIQSIGKGGAQKFKDGSQPILNSQCGQCRRKTFLGFRIVSKFALSRAPLLAPVGPSAPISNAMTGAALNFMSNSNGACESPTFCAVQKEPIYALNVVLNYQRLEQ